MSWASLILWGVFLGQGWDAKDWRVVNDSVMGGVSTSQIVDHDVQGVVFRGDLSLENNGGFTSTRLEIVGEDWSEFDAVKVVLNGDGRDYLLTVRTRDRRMRRIYYRYPVSTVAGQSISIVAPFEEFKAFAFGTPVPEAPSLRTQLTRLGSVGIMLADKNPGPFSLHVEALEPHQSEAFEPMEMGASLGSISEMLLFAIEQGVPLYNGGEPERCADVYQTTLVSLLFLAQDKLSDREKERMTEALRMARAEASDSERAWILRRAIDDVLEMRR